MKIVRKIIFAVIGIVVLLLIVAAFLPSQYRVERSIEINRPDSLVYVKALNFHERRSWDPWIELDPEAQFTVNGPEGQPGWEWSWEGSKTGKGSLTLLKAEANRLIHSRVVFIKPQGGESDVFMRFTPTASGTMVDWSFEGKADYPFGRYLGMMMDKFVGADFERGLANLKRVCEQ